MPPTKESRASARPPPPPKPSHLSVAFTGTLNSETLREYIQDHRKSSFRESILSDAVTARTDLTVRANIDATIRKQKDRCSSISGQSEGKESCMEVWGTARQQTPSPVRPVLAHLFVNDSVAELGSYNDITKKWENMTPKHARHVGSDISMVDTSGMSTPFEYQRSREPSILSRISSFEEDHDELGKEDWCAVSPSDKCNFDAASLESPPKKRVYVQGGSTFDLTGPRSPSAGRRRMQVGTSHSEQGHGETCPGTMSRTETQTSLNNQPAPSNGLPAPSSGLPILIAGPPPLRPKSLAVDEETDHFAGENNLCVPNSGDESRIRSTARSARALYPFEGQQEFNELTLKAGQVFFIINENVRGGWSLGAVQRSSEQGWVRGLVPKGWYTYIQEFTSSPKLDPTPTVTTPTAGDHVAAPITDVKSSFLTPVQDRDARQALEGRPASAIGHMTCHVEGKGAVEMLTQMSRAPSSSSAFHTAAYVNEVQQISHASGSESEIYASSTNKDGGSEDVTQDISKSEQKPTSSAERPWRPSGMLRGRSMNRYAPFVVSGAEEYILSSTVKHVEEDIINEHEQKHTIISRAQGEPGWKHSGVFINVDVHSPEIHKDERGKDYMAFVVHSSYTLTPENDDGTKLDILWDPYLRPEEPSATSSVYRRFNHFRWLSNYLHKYYPTIAMALPPLPRANHGAGKSVRFASQFVEARRRHLQSWLLSVVRHPLLSSDQGVRFFLDSDHEGLEWIATAKQIENNLVLTNSDQSSREVLLSPAAHLFAFTVHPNFNVDCDETLMEALHVDKFSQMYEKSMCFPDQGVLANHKKFRNTFLDTSESYRQLSCALLRLQTGTGLGLNATRRQASDSPGQGAMATLPPMGKVGCRDETGVTNEDRAWCWRECCSECHKLTCAMQATVNALQGAANKYQQHANGSLFELHDQLWNMSRAHARQTSLLEVHHSALSLYKEALGEQGRDVEDHVSVPVHSSKVDEVASRCETVLNVTMGEMDRIHSERIQDWTAISRSLLDAQISFYQDLLDGLQDSRTAIDDILHRDSSGPILPSPYETQLTSPLSHPQLLMPSMQLTPYSAAALAIRPVSLAGEVLSEWLGGGYTIR